MRKYLLLFFGVSLKISFAQNSITNESFAGLTAFESFQERKYESVISNLKGKIERSDDEDILLMLSLLKTGQGNSDNVENWLEKHPKHPIKPLVHYHLGEFFYYSNDTLKSKKLLKSIKGNDLSTRDRASYGYIYGLLMLDEENYQDAKNLFQFARKHQYESVSKLDYYEAFSSYHLNKTDEALRLFEKSRQASEFENSAKFFIAKIRLDNGEIDQVIALAQSELSDDVTLTNSGFHQLTGEAYALKNETSKADAFFARAIELHPGKPSAALFYQAGVSKFKIGNESAAIDFLTEAGIQGGEYAQLSALQLGRLYLKKEDFEKALSAYIESSVSKDKDIREESYFQITNIEAKQGQYSEAISYGIDYLKNFKTSKRREEIQNIIAQSYLRTSNFDLAIEHLKEIGITNTTQKSVYQKVTYQKAVLSFNDADFIQAEKWFKESIEYPIEIELKDDALYHLAEIAMRNSRFSLAIDYYQKQSKLNGLSNYGIGYAKYNMRDYESAIPYFKDASVGATDDNVQLDAKVRLADCLYATKNYDGALVIYNELERVNGSSYITYQKGMSLIGVGRGEEAIQSFARIANTDRYKIPGIFQSGMIEFEAANFEQARSYFSLVVDAGINDYIVDARLNRAISSKNIGKMEAAKQDFETILKDHINSDASINAILGLQELQQAGIEVKKLEEYIANYRKINPKSGSLELIEFEAAKRLYFNFSYLEAAKAFKKYLKDYPGSRNTDEAKYYQADACYRIDEIESAKPLLDELKYVRNPLTGRILSRLGEINRRLKLENESEEAYTLLKDLDLTAKDTYNARQGLMLLFFEAERYNESITAANDIISAEWKPLNAEFEAIIVKARCWMELGNSERAKENYLILANVNNAYGAESNYGLGLIMHNQEMFDESLDQLFKLNSNYGSYTDWVDKSYLLIAKNYVAKKELFQAKATLRSIIQHSKNEEVILESKNLLNEIEQTSIASDSTQNRD